jgi:uncharacterized protein
MALWDQLEESGNVEDRRGNPGVGGLGSIGVLGTVLVIGFSLLTGADPIQLLNQIQTTQPTTSQGEFVDTKGYVAFSKRVIGSNNRVWKAELAKQGIEYKNPKLVLFRGGTQSGCGGADSQSGPHYCPADQTIYLDETFFDELTGRYGAKGGDVAEAYVMAHEVGHHVQKIRGTFARNDQSDNQTSVNIELQADCFAGVWAGTIKSEGIISDTEINQAIDAAETVGDDRIQKQSGGRVNPETWTHGSSAQRKDSFLRGYNSLDSNQCNTVR